LVVCSGERRRWSREFSRFLRVAREGVDTAQIAAVFE
jgi:hypothetical protein